MLDKIIAGLAILLALAACAPDDEKASDKAKASASPAAMQAKKMEAASNAASAAPEAKSLPAEAPEAKNLPEAPAVKEAAPEPVSREEYERADKILAFANQARSRLERNFSRPAAHIRENVLEYLDTWHLPKMPKIAPRKADIEKMTPESGIFSVAEEQKLATALDGMDKAIGEMAAHYRELASYGADSRIRDDGKRGRQLGNLVAESYGRFSASQHSWLEIVESAAENAEEKFLRSHPLQRQIAGARSIFAQFREIAALINSGSADIATLTSLRQSIEDMAAECAKPPFNASPALERLYRHFLGETRVYCRTLNQAMAEGLHAAQKRELNIALENCRDAYNEFVRQANFLTDN